MIESAHPKKIYVSMMEDEYVRKDVFDETVKRLENENLRNCEKFAYVFQQQGLKHRKDIDALRVENDALGDNGTGCCNRRRPSVRRLIMRKHELLHPMTEEERRAYRASLLREMLWSFFKPIIIGWGGFALFVWLVRILKG